MRIPVTNVALLLFFLAAVAVFCMLAPNFATASNMEDLMAGFSFIAIIAIGESFPILLKGIDLSVGATLALAGMVAFDCSLLLAWPGYVAIFLALVVATLAGALNGLMIVVLRLPPFIATLATLAAYRGTVYAISGRQLSPSVATTPIRDAWITGLDTYFDFGAWTGLSKFFATPDVPLSFLIMLGAFVIFQFLLSATKFGRDLYTVGGNTEAARLAGIDVGLTTVIAYSISGFCAGLGGLLLVARLTTATESLGMGTEMSAIAAAVIGGVSLSGGSGNVFGPIIGAFLLGVVLIGLTLLNISQFVQQILTGAILLAAVGHDRLMSNRRRRLSGTVVAGAH